MGLFKFLLGPFNPFGPGLPIRPTTRKERYMRDSLKELEKFNHQVASQNQSATARGNNYQDVRPRGTCPACLEMILVGASKCMHCGTEGIIWPNQK
jgi:hypothetical protein